MRIATPFDPIEVGEIDNFAFAHAAGTGLADADDVQRAGGIYLADDGADL